MAKLDAALKHAMVEHPADWARLFGVSRRTKVRVEDSDIATVSYAVDKVFRVEAKEPYIIHPEPQAYYDEHLDVRLYSYNGILTRRHNITVHTVAILLAPSAWGPANRGHVKKKSPLGRCKIDFEYDVIRIWEIPADKLLKAGVGVAPLALIADVAEKDLPQLIKKMEKRFERDASRADQADLWTVAYVLVGLKYDEAIAHSLLQGVTNIMQESSTYQAIIREGEERGEKKGALKAKQEDVLLLGAKQLGKPRKKVRDAIMRIDQLERLDELLLRVLEAKSWDELLEKSSDGG